jgi:SCY1-like protein 1
MFVKRTESLTANMPDTVLTPEDQQQAAALSPNTSVAGSKGQPGLAESAGGAAVALAGWAFTSLSSRLANTDLATPMLERRASTPSGANSNQLQPGARADPSTAANRIGNLPAIQSQQRSNSQPNLPAITTSLHGNGNGSVGSSSARSSLALGGSSGLLDDILDSDPMAGSGDWGGDLIDVAADQDDFDEFESAQPAPVVPAEPIVHPRYTITRAAPSTSKKPLNGSIGKKVSSLGGGSTNKATGASRAAASVLKEIEAEEGGVGGAGDWAFDAEDAGASANDNGWGAEEEEQQQPIAPSTPTISSHQTSTTSSPASQSTTTSNLAKDKLAQMREERKARLAAAKEKKASVLGAKKL